MNKDKNENSPPPVPSLLKELDNLIGTTFLNRKKGVRLKEVDEFLDKEENNTMTTTEEHLKTMPDIAPLRAVSFKTVNNVTSVEGKNVSDGHIGAARIAFSAGAEEMANRFRSEMKTGDMKRILVLLAATETNSFYAENSSGTQPN